MKIGKMMIVFFSLLILTISCVAADSVSITPSTYDMPQSFDLAKHYYTVYGSPNITATIMGNDELERGQFASLNIQLMNKGKLLGFQNTNTPSDPDETFAAQTEMKLESSITNQ